MQLKCSSGVPECCKGAPLETVSLEGSLPVPWPYLSNSYASINCPLSNHRVAVLEGAFQPQPLPWAGCPHQIGLQTVNCVWNNVWYPPKWMHTQSNGKTTQKHYLLSPYLTQNNTARFTIIKLLIFGCNHMLRRVLQQHSTKMNYRPLRKKMYIETQEAWKSSSFLIPKCFQCNSVQSEVKAFFHFGFCF